MMDDNFNFDPLQVQRIADELQLRIGILPKVEVFVLHLEAHPGEVTQTIRVQPRSLSEIFRVVRAARTMKLCVRGVGHASGCEKEIYIGMHTVLIDCCQLSDEPRMQITEIVREGEGEKTPGLRILAGVSNDELTEFLVDHEIELFQSSDINSGLGTIVGCIQAANPGVFAPTSGALGGFIADEVLEMRVVDCRGELITYSSPFALEEFTANIGLIGIMYDVVLRYRTLSACKVQFSFHDWCHLTNSASIYRSILKNDITELIYIPFNSLKPDNLVDENRWKWCVYSDSVIVRSCKRLNILQDEPLDCHKRHKFHIIDPILGPDIHRLVTEPQKTPQILSEAFVVLKRKLLRKNNQVQFTPWATNSFAPLPSPSRLLRVSLETGACLETFSNSMRSILEILMQLLKPESETEYNFGLNLCIRIQFTGGTRKARIFGVSCLNPNQPSSDKLLAHINIASFVRPGPFTNWSSIAFQLTRFTADNIPKSIIQWKTEWHDVKRILKLFMDKLPRRWGPFKYQMIKRDRDGVFMNDRLQLIFFQTLEEYQREYRRQRQNYIRTV